MTDGTATKTPVHETQPGRRRLAAKGHALEDGSYPIPNVAYLKKAIRAVGRAGPGKRPALGKLIRKRARQLGSAGMAVLKGSWADTSQSAKAMANACQAALELANGGCDHKCYPGEQKIHSRLKAKGLNDKQATALAHNSAKRAAAAKGNGNGGIAAAGAMRPKVREFVGPKGYEHGWKFVGVPGESAGRVLVSISRKPGSGAPGASERTAARKAFNSAHKAAASGPKTPGFPTRGAMRFETATHRGHVEVELDQQGKLGAGKKAFEDAFNQVASGPHAPGFPTERDSSFGPKRKK